MFPFHTKLPISASGFWLLWSTGLSVGICICDVISIEQRHYFREISGWAIFLLSDFTTWFCETTMNGQKHREAGAEHQSCETGRFATDIEQLFHCVDVTSGWFYDNFRCARFFQFCLHPPGNGLWDLAAGTTDHQNRAKCIHTDNFNLNWRTIINPLTRKSTQLTDEDAAIIKSAEHRTAIADAKTRRLMWSVKRRNRLPKNGIGNGFSAGNVSRHRFKRLSIITTAPLNNPQKTKLIRKRLADFFKFRGIRQIQRASFPLTALALPALAQPIVGCQNIKRHLMYSIFIRRIFPCEIIRVEMNHFPQKRNGCQEWLERLAIYHMYKTAPQTPSANLWNVGWIAADETQLPVMIRLHGFMNCQPSINAAPNNSNGRVVPPTFGYIGCLQ